MTEKEQSQVLNLHRFGPRACVLSTLLHPCLETGAQRLESEIGPWGEESEAKERRTYVSGTTLARKEPKV